MNRNPIGSCGAQKPDPTGGFFTCERIGQCYDFHYGRNHSINTHSLPRPHKWDVEEDLETPSIQAGGTLQ